MMKILTMRNQNTTKRFKPLFARVLLYLVFVSSMLLILYNLGGFRDYIEFDIFITIGIVTSFLSEMFSRRSMGLFSTLLKGDTYAEN